MKVNLHFKKTTYLFGIIGEYIAIIYLTLKGYRILHHRYRSHYGEIDIIAAQKHHLVFVEVKLRKHLHSLGEIIRTPQKKRIIRSAKQFLNYSSSSLYRTIQFDVIFISPWRLPLHFKNIWEE